MVATPAAWPGLAYPLLPAVPPYIRYSMYFFCPIAVPFFLSFLFLLVLSSPTHQESEILTQLSVQLTTALEIKVTEDDGVRR